MHRPMPPPDLDFLVLELDDIIDFNDDEQQAIWSMNNIMQSHGITEIRRIRDGLRLQYVGGRVRGVDLR